MLKLLGLEMDRTRMPCHRKEVFVPSWPTFFQVAYGGRWLLLMVVIQFDTFLRRRGVEFLKKWEFELDTTGGADSLYRGVSTIGFFPGLAHDSHACQFLKLSRVCNV